MSESPSPPPDDGQIAENLRLLSVAVDAADRLTRALKEVQKSEAKDASLFARRLWVFGSSMIDTMTYRMPTNSDFFEHLPALGADCRNLMEAHVAFIYFVADDVDDSERAFRHLLFRRHADQNALNLLKADIDAYRPEPEVFATLEMRLIQLQQMITEHPAFATRNVERRKAIKSLRRDGYTKSIFDSDQEVLGRAGLSHTFHETRFRLGSQGTHATPFSFAHDSFLANKSGGKRRMTLMFLIWAIELVGNAIGHLRRLFPEVEKDLGDVSEIAEFIVLDHRIDWGNPEPQ